jgi:hypothetical protein
VILQALQSLQSLTLQSTAAGGGELAVAPCTGVWAFRVAGEATAADVSAAGSTGVDATPVPGAPDVMLEAALLPDDALLALVVSVDAALLVLVVPVDAVLLVELVEPVVDVELELEVLSVDDLWVYS